MLLMDVAHGCCRTLVSRFRFGRPLQIPYRFSASSTSNAIRAFSTFQLTSRPNGLNALNADHVDYVNWIFQRWLSAISYSRPNDVLNANKCRQKSSFYLTSRPNRLQCRLIFAVGFWIDWNNKVIQSEFRCSFIHVFPNFTVSFCRPTFFVSPSSIILICACSASPVHLPFSPTLLWC